MAELTVDYETQFDSLERAANVMTITERDGKRRVITLSATAMPRRGVSWGMEQRIVESWPAGAGESTQQILGPIQSQTPMTGVWRRSWLGRSPVQVEEEGRKILIVYPKTLRDLFYDVLKQASLLQVTWRSTTRIGRLATFSCPHDREEDISWEATFKWMNAGNMFPQRMVSTRDQGVRAEVDGLLLVSENLINMEASTIPVDDRTPRPKETPKLTLGQVSAMLSAPNNALNAIGRNVRELVNKAKAAADLATQFRNFPMELNNTILATAENIIAQCNQWHDEFSRKPTEELTFDHRVASMAQTQAYYDEAARQTTYLARTAADLAEKSRRRRQGSEGIISSQFPTTGDLLALHIVRVGDTLAGISVKYYGTADHAYDIAKVNKIAYPIAPVSTATGKPTMGGKSILNIPRL